MSFKDRLRLSVITGCAALVAVNCAHEAENQTVKSGAQLREWGSRDGDRDGPGEEERKK